MYLKYFLLNLFIFIFLLKFFLYIYKDKYIFPFRKAEIANFFSNILINSFITISIFGYELLINTIKTTHRALSKDFEIDKPRISVAGLNPHAGEDGTFGNEENNIIIPVLNKLRTEGMNILGPMSADTMFHEQARKNYDVAICMYHDQALIPLKAIDFYGGVNTTLGLPFIRTSPDHGTAFELAGTRNANPSSLINALKIAYKMAKIREK